MAVKPALLIFDLVTKSLLEESIGVAS